MAVLISTATGNFTSSSTWRTTDTTSGSVLDSEANNTALSTTPADSATWTPGAGLVYDGILIKIAARVASPSGNLIVVLRNTTDATDEKTVTISVSEITANGVTWLYAKFASTFTTVAAKAYAVRLSVSVNSEVTVYRNATTSNWTRYIATNTNAAPGSADVMHIVGAQSGGGAITAYTVTMNETASTSYGAVANTESLSINHGGTLTWGTTASTNYLLTIKGVIRVFAGGTWNMGTSGTRMPSSSTATLQFKPTVSLDSSLRCEAGGVLNVYGTRPSSIYQLLTTNAAVSDTSVVVADATGWGGTDRIGIAPTNRTYTEAEVRTLTSISTNTLNFSGGLSYTHSGNATGGPNSESIQAEVINLTRNCKILGDTTSLLGYTITNGTGVSVFDSVQFDKMGSNSSNRGAIGVVTTTGSVTADYCSFEGTSAATQYAIYTTNSSYDNLSVSYCVSYGMSTLVTIPATSGTTLSITNCVAIGGHAGASTLFSIGDRTITLTNLRSSGASSIGISVSESLATGGAAGVWSNFIAHTNASTGITVNNSYYQTLSGFKAWRNAGTGMTVGGIHSVLDAPVSFGNTTQNLNFGFGHQFIFSAAVLNGESSFASAYNVLLNSTYYEMSLINSALSGVTAPSTAEFSMSGPVTAYRNSSVTVVNTTVGAGTLIASSDFTGLVTSPLLFLKHNATSGDHRLYDDCGLAQTDTAIYSAASPSIRITPLAATRRTQVPCGKANVASGANPTITVKVRESVVGDGTDYNGSRIRLMVRANALAGITSDTVLATATVASEGAFETLSGSTGAVSADCVLEFYVDCGFTGWTTGWVNFDDFTCSTNADSKGMKYWGNAGPFAVSDNAAAGGGGGGVIGSRIRTGM